MRENAATRFARQLRANMTDAERLLWRRLRCRQVDGCRFRRQHPLGPYIADFACLERALVIEVDGGQHEDSEGDRRRDAWMRHRGFEVLRFWNNEVMENIEGVCEVIHGTLVRARPHPGLPPQAGEGDRRADPGLPPRAGEGDRRADPGLSPQAGEGDRRADPGLSPQAGEGDRPLDVCST